MPRSLPGGPRITARSTSGISLNKTTLFAACRSTGSCQRPRSPSRCKATTTWRIASPDGSKALLDHTDTDQLLSGIYVINADGTGLHQLTTGQGTVTSISWSPDGAKIAYSYQLFDTVHIYFMNTDGSNQTQIGQSLSDSCCPVWSPDGTKLALEHNDDDGYTDIYTVNANGSNLRNLTENNVGANDFGPTWSPDGTQIAFVTYRNDDWFLYTMSADGSNPAQLSPGAGFFQNLRWSSDGDKVAFIKDFVVGFASSASRPDLVIPVTETDLGVVDIATHKETRLTFREQAPFGYVWSH